MNARNRAALAGLALAAAAADGQTFIGFEDVLGNGYEWHNIDIADDGRAAILQGRIRVGASYERAIAVWKEGQGFTEIPAPGGSIDHQRGIGMSAISGNGETVLFRSGDQAFQWNEIDGPSPTPLTTTTSPYWARDISTDGTTLVGQVRVAATDQEPSYLQGARWMPDGPVEFLTVPIADRRAAVFPKAVSRNGDWVAGAFADPSTKRAGLWGPNGEWINLAEHLPLTVSSSTYAVSNNGTIAFGGIAEFGRSKAFRWAQGQTPQIFDFFAPTHDDMLFLDTTADGTVAVGRSGELAVESIAIVWSESRGTRSVQQMLTDAGVDIGAWQLERVDAISADGKVIAGIGTAPNGQLGAWIVTSRSSPATPCPGDLNADGVLSPADFNAWLLAFNAGDPAADQNGDGFLSAADFGAWIANFNAGC